MSNRYLFIVNSSSNSGRIQKKIEWIRMEADKAFEDYEFFFSSDKNATQEKIKDSLSHFDIFIACGGDGTIQSIAEVLIGTGKTMGAIPFGSGNDFSKLINKDKNLKSFIEVIQDGRSMELDIIKTNYGVTVNTFGIGFDGLTNLYASKIKRLPGSFKYMFAALKALFVAQKFSASIEINKTESFEIETHMILVANGKWEGGKFLISKDSEPGDGKLEMIISITSLKIGLLYQFLRLSLGLDLTKKSFKKISFENARILVNKSVIAHSDGEVVYPKLLFTLNIIKSQIKFLIR